MLLKSNVFFCEKILLNWRTLIISKDLIWILSILVKLIAAGRQLAAGSSRMSRQALCPGISCKPEPVASCLVAEFFELKWTYSDLIKILYIAPVNTRRKCYCTTTELLGRAPRTSACSRAQRAWAWPACRTWRTSLWPPSSPAFPESGVLVLPGED